MFESDVRSFLFRIPPLILLHLILFELLVLNSIIKARHFLAYCISTHNDIADYNSKSVVLETEISDSSFYKSENS